MYTQFTMQWYRNDNERKLLSVEMRMEKMITCHYILLTMCSTTVVHCWYRLQKIFIELCEKRERFFCWQGSERWKKSRNGNFCCHAVNLFSLIASCGFCVIGEMCMRCTFTWLLDFVCTKLKTLGMKRHKKNLRE